jgi:hypothetical protein
MGILMLPEKLVLPLGACSLAIAPLATASPAFADPAKGPAANVQEFCTAYVQQFEGYTFGNCVGILRSDDSAGAAKFCWELAKFDLLWWVGTENQGQCVKFLISLREAQQGPAVRTP